MTEQQNETAATQEERLKLFLTQSLTLARNSRRNSERQMLITLQALMNVFAHHPERGINGDMPTDEVDAILDEKVKPYAPALEAALRKVIELSAMSTDEVVARLIHDAAESLAIAALGAAAVPVWLSDELCKELEGLANIDPALFASRVPSGEEAPASE